MLKTHSIRDFRIIIGLAISCAPILVYSAPSISGVYRSLDTENKVIVITGTNFTEAPNVVLFDNFERGNDGQVVPLDSPMIGNWSGYGTLGQPRYTSKSDDGLGYFVRDFERPITDGNRQAQLIKKFDSYQDEIYFSFSAKVPQGFAFAGASQTNSFPSVSSWKFSWLMSGSTGYENGDGQFDICIPTHVGNGSFLLGGNDGNLTYIDDGSKWWDWNNFNDIAFHIAFDKGSPSSGPINWFIEITSGKNYSFNSGEASPTKFNNTDNRFDRVNFSGWWGNGSLENFSGIYDNIYIAIGDNTKSRVVITNNKLRNLSTRSITVPAISWSNNKIEIDEQVIPDWNESYFHISDMHGVFSNEGSPICPNCPSPVKPTIE
ncbi:hypothetical protein [Marinobacter sp.]|uniref:hypothetical protein n=1 Tax=Marinobacter sp. TaxID=50741 RepID=UPI0019C5CF2A|nr:hypothetical protein [Marinobacter sp.]MBD3656209.1 hypothetical protein [Marinobacter sp.]